MLRFRVHDPKGPDGTGSNGSWPLRSAYLVGPDGRPAPGKVSLAGGAIACEAEREQPVGLALLVDTGGAGRIVLQTCFLPSQDEPYDLFIEIARWLIKQFILQSESWQMWNPALSGEALHQWESAREAFRAALRCPEPPQAEVLARKQADEIAAKVVAEAGPAGIGDRKVVALVAYLMRIGTDLDKPVAAPAADATSIANAGVPDAAQGGGR